MESADDLPYQLSKYTEEAAAQLSSKIREKGKGATSERVQAGISR